MSIPLIVACCHIHELPAAQSRAPGVGVRVLIRTMKKITKITDVVGTKLCDRSRSVKFRLLKIGRVARAKDSINRDKLKERFGQL